MQLILVTLACFPFVKWFGYGMGSDIQPYCLIGSGIIICLFGIKNIIYITKDIKKIFWIVLSGLIIGSIFTLIFSGSSFNDTIRYYATYVGIIIYILIFYNLLLKNNGLPENIIKVCINVYFIVGMVQKYLRADFLYNWIPNERTSLNRGVIALASEPSFYGYMCIFFLLFAIDFKKGRKFYIINLLFQIFVLAQSSVTILYIMILIGLGMLYLLSKVDIKKGIAATIFICCIAIAGYYLIMKYASTSRMAYFINIIMQQNSLSGILSNLNSDGSVYIRFNDIIVCLEGFVKYVGVPHGFNTRKISSGYGSLLYTMGWAGFALIVCFYHIMKEKYIATGIKKIIPLWISIILFSAIQLSNPIISLYFAYCLWSAGAVTREETTYIIRQAV